MSTAPGKVRPLGQPDAATLYALRLESLLLHPEAFGATHSQTADIDPEAYVKTFIPAEPGVMLGGFVGGELVSTVGMFVPSTLKQRHKGHIYAVYLRAAHRRTGLVGTMLDMVIARSRAAGLRFLDLSVTVGNLAARRLYISGGFRSVGVLPRSLLVDGRFYDEELMHLDLDDAP